MSELTDVIQHPQDAVDKIAALSARIARLEAAGDKLLKRWHHIGMQYEICDGCGNESAFEFSNVAHAPDCPVTLWEKAKLPQPDTDMGGVG